MKKLETVTIKGEYITLGQLLKFVRIVDRGGEEKEYLKTHEILVNGETEQRRGKKLRPGDKVETEEGEFLIQ